MYMVRRSRVHGKGLFSTKRIPRGMVIGVCDTEEAAEDCIYTLWVDDKGYKVTCDFRYINHSESPNVAYCDDFSVIALENISRGQELFHDYDQ